MDDLKAEAERLVGLARSRKITLVTVESCTAGALACALAEAEGAGEVFHGGFVTYSKESKSFAVGVPLEVISKHTAVSAQVRPWRWVALREVPTLPWLSRVWQGQIPTKTAIRSGWSYLRCDPRRARA